MGYFRHDHVLGLMLLAALLASVPHVLHAKEFLTPKEIEKVQDAQEIDRRVKVYLDAAELRLKTAEERLSGKESSPGDPLEFFSVEELVEGYYQILRSVMFNLDEAYQKPGTEEKRIEKALKELRDTTKKASKSLGVLQRLAEDRRDEGVWMMVRQALDITRGANEGAELGLSRKADSKKRAP